MIRLRHAAAAAIAGLLLAGGTPAAAQPSGGEALFNARCKMCHEPAVPRAPGREQLRAMAPQQMLAALTTGTMKPMADGLSPAQVGSLVTYLTGRAPVAPEGGPTMAQAAPAPADADPDAAAAEILGKARPVSAAMLKAPSPGDWLHWGRTYDGQNFSPLTRIDRKTVKGLAPAWRRPIPAGPSMPTPLVHDGVMFLQTSPDTVLALDATSGAVLWRKTYKPAGPSSQKMGLAIAGGRIFVPTSDLHVIALDAKTGARVWDHEIAIEPPASIRRLLNLRSAPLVVGDKVIQGVTASGSPGGGFIVGLDIATGREVWRFHTIARPDAPGGNSWNGLPLARRSGGSVWQQGTYDPDLRLVYYGIGQTYDTGPLNKPSGVAGTTQDALYTDSTVALDPDTGRLVWHYQHLSNDQWDLDWSFERQLATIAVDGKPRRVVMNIGKMGILDALDAKTGAYLFSIDAGGQNVITGIDPRTGAKTTDPAKWPDKTKSTQICPNATGVRNWPSTTVNPKTGQLFLPVTRWCLTFGPPERPGFTLLSSGVGFTPSDHPEAAASGRMGGLQAMDLKGRRNGWRQDLAAPISTSVLATAGGVIFAGDLDPALAAYDDRDGRVLWRAPLDNWPSANVVTYAVGGTQYVAVVTGMKNFHINDLARRYQMFRQARGTTVETPKGEPAVVVFALGKR